MATLTAKPFKLSIRPHITLVSRISGCRQVTRTGQAINTRIFKMTSHDLVKSCAVATKKDHEKIINLMAMDTKEAMSVKK